MMKYPEYVALKLPRDVVESAKQQAQADDRTVSAYLRRIIIAAVSQKTQSLHESESR